MCARARVILHLNNNYLLELSRGAATGAHVGAVYASLRVPSAFLPPVSRSRCGREKKGFRSAELWIGIHGVSAFPTFPFAIAVSGERDFRERMLSSSMVLFPSSSGELKIARRDEVLGKFANAKFSFLFNANTILFNTRMSIATKLKPPILT